ncbi:MAG: hypothetical protein U0792_07790 [Gemmataceae bacterium]
MPDMKRLFVQVNPIPDCGEEIIEILELQPAGKRRMTAEEFLRGLPGGATRFGPEVLA